MKEAVQILENEFFKDEKHLKDFSIDRLSQMNPSLDNSLLSHKDKLSRMRSHECLYIFFNQMLFLFFFCFELYSSFYGTLTKCVERTISDWTDLGSQTQECRSQAFMLGVGNNCHRLIDKVRIHVLFLNKKKKKNPCSITVLFNSPFLKQEDVG